MKILRALIAIVLVVLALIFSHAVSAQPPAEIAKQEFAAQYQKATSETARMQLAIGAINSGLIYIRMPVEDIDVLFGTNYKAKIPQKSQTLEAGVIEFKPPAILQPWSIPVAFEGWYFAFVFDFSGRVTDYTLSNVRK